MKKKLLVCFMIVLFFILGYGITKNENQEVAIIQENEVIEEDYIESIENEKEQATEIVVPEIEIAEESKILEQTKTNDEVVSSNTENKNVLNTNQQKEKETKKKQEEIKNSNLSISENKTKDEIKGEDTNKKIVQATPVLDKEIKNIIHNHKNEENYEEGKYKEWFDSKSEAYKYYDGILDYWNEKSKNNEIKSSEYYAKCPYRLSSIGL